MFTLPIRRKSAEYGVCNSMEELTGTFRCCGKQQTKGINAKFPKDQSKYSQFPEYDGSKVNNFSTMDFFKNKTKEYGIGFHVNLGLNHIITFFICVPVKNSSFEILFSFAATIG